MKLLRTNLWNWWDLVVLKWSCLFFGMLAGAYFHEIVMEYFLEILLAATLLAVRSVFVFRKETDRPP